MSREHGAIYWHCTVLKPFFFGQNGSHHLAKIGGRAHTVDAASRTVCPPLAPSILLLETVLGCSGFELLSEVQVKVDV